MTGIALVVVGMWAGFGVGLVVAGRGRMAEALREHTADEGFSGGLEGVLPQA